MPTSAEVFRIGADQQAAANERERADTAKAVNEATSYKTKDEKAEAERMALYDYHKRAGSLAMYYHQYPMDPGARRFYADQQRER